MSAFTLPITFRAVGCASTGAPFESIARSIDGLQADEVLVRVSYASINAMDGKVHQHNFPQLPLPFVLGYDFSGVLVAVGTPAALSGESESDGLTVGSEVMGSTFGIRWGGGCFAEYAVAKRDRVSLRGVIPLAEASTYGLAYQGAYDSLCVATDIRTRAGQWIYIPGGSGNVGHFAVQLAKAYGLRVVSSSSKLDGLDLLRKLQADVVIDHTKVDVVQEVLKATDGRGADVVFDATYAESSLTQSAAVLAKGGQWIRMGSWMMAPPALKQQVESTVAKRDGTMLFGDLARYTMDPAYKDKVPLLLSGLSLAKQLYGEGRVKPHISAILPFKPDALQQAVQNKSAVGKVVVKVE